MRAAFQSGDASGETVGNGGPRPLPSVPSTSGWASLGTPAKELRLDNTLPTGQSFRWRKTVDGDYVGVIGERVVSMRQSENDVLYRVHCRPSGSNPSTDAAALSDYFNLEVDLTSLSKQWADADVRFRKLEPFLPGCRMLRQDPAECLFSFICSSNNHISRIHGMVERLCAAYGTELHPDGLNDVLKAVPVKTKNKPTPKKQKVDAEAMVNASLNASPAKAVGVTSLSSPPSTPVTNTPPSEHLPGEPLGAFFAFPTVDQLLAASEDQLREMGFGYRAKFIAGTAQVLSLKPGGAALYLKNLRENTPYREAQLALTELPGVGPKVAACACLFSLDKHQAIPVDTHVWQLAVEHYTPDLEGKTLTPKIMAKVEDTIVGVFGDYAGWAHNTLFVAELAHVRAALPEDLRTPPRAKTPKKEKKDTVVKKEKGNVGDAESIPSPAAKKAKL